MDFPKLVEAAFVKLLNHDRLAEIDEATLVVITMTVAQLLMTHPEAVAVAAKSSMDRLVGAGSDSAYLH